MSTNSTVVERDAHQVSPANSRLPAVFMAAIALVVSTISLSFDPRSGSSSEFMLGYLGVDRAHSVSFPLWHTLLDLIDRVPAGTLAFRAGVLSVLSGALCIYLLTRILQQARRDYVTPEDAPLASLFCTLPGVGYLLVSLPFLMAADRSHPVLLHLALLLMVVRGLQGFADGGATTLLVGASLVAGLATPEWWGIALMAPALFYMAIRAAITRADDVPTGAVLLVVGWVVGLLGTLALVRYRELQSVPPGAFSPDLSATLMALLDAHWLAIIADSDPTLWACFLLGALLPWLLAVYCSNQLAIGSAGEWAILHLIFTAIAAVFLGFGAINIRGDTDPLNSLSLLGFVFSAATFGYCCAFWYALFDGDLTSEGQVVSGGKPALLFVILLLLGGSTIQHFPRTDVLADKLLNQWAKATVSEFPDETILTGDGPLYHQLVLTAIQADRTVHPIHGSQLADPTYLYMLQRRFSSPSLAKLLQIAPDAVQDILLTLPETSSHPIAMLDPLALNQCPWVAFDIGTGVYFANLPPADPAESSPSPAQNWQILADRMPTSGSRSSHPVLKSLRQHTGRLANDLGVQQVESGDVETALDTLTLATALDPHTPVPRVNRALARAGTAADDGPDEDWTAVEYMLLSNDQASPGRILHGERVRLLQQGLSSSYHALPENGFLREAIRQFLSNSPDALDTAEKLTDDPETQDPAHTKTIASHAGLLIAVNGIVAGDPLSIKRGMEQVDRSRVKPAHILRHAARWAITHKNLELAREHILEGLTLEPRETETLELATLFNLLYSDSSDQDIGGQRLLHQGSGNPFAGLYQARQSLERNHIEAAEVQLAQIRNIHRLPAIQVIYTGVLLQLEKTGDAVRSANKALANAEVTSVTYWQRLGEQFDRLNRPILSTYAGLRADRLQSVRDHGADTVNIEEALLSQVRVSRDIAQPAPSPGMASPVPVVQESTPYQAIIDSPTGAPKTRLPRPTAVRDGPPVQAVSPADAHDDEHAEVPLKW